MIECTSRRGVMLAVIGALTTAAHAMPWHHAPSPHRAVVAITAAGSPGVDVAALRIRHGGSAHATGNDYRLFTGDGRPVAYEITHHDPARDTLISLRCPDTARTFAVYFGSGSPEPDAMRAVRPPAVGGGPPRPGRGAAGWIPRAGLVLTTLRRPIEDANPKTVAALQALIDRAPAVDGAGYRTNISDGYNPFGDSDHYVSIYRGWLDLPTSGRYGFCTASNEASFSFIDGETLVHWPGRHTEQRGRFGQKNREHDLVRGLRYIEYYHEEVLLYQVAFLGVRPPGAEHYGGIDAAAFPQPHRARVDRYEHRDAGRAPVIRCTLVDSAWPEKRVRGQYTRYRFRADAGTAPFDFGDRPIAWSFGDGRTAEGVEVEHVYLRLGSFDVSMTFTGDDGTRFERRWPLTVHAIEHLDGPYRNAAAVDYRPVVAGYDPASLTTRDLAAWGRYHDEIGDAATAASAAQALLERSDAAPADRADAHWLAAATAERPREHLQAALALEPDAVRRLEIGARLIRVAGTEEEDLAAAETLFDALRTDMTQAGLTGRARAAYRHVLVAIGDGRLAARQRDGAYEAFLLAEALADPPVPLAVRQTRIGDFHERVAAHVAARRIDAAAGVVDAWRSQFPADQCGGEIPFWRGRIAFERGADREAVGWFALSVDLAEGSEFEAESRFLMAQAARRVGDEAAYRRALADLIGTGIGGAFRERALEELAQADEREGEP